MLDESEKKRKAEKERADAAEAELAEMQFEKDICCDGKASVTKKMSDTDLVERRKSVTND